MMKLKDPLDKDEETILIGKYLNGDKEAGNTVLLHNMKLVYFRVKKYIDRSYYDELVDVGMFGLAKALNSYKLERLVRFNSYAIKCIDNEISMFFRKLSRTPFIDSLDAELTYIKNTNLGDTIAIDYNFIDDIYNDWDLKVVYKELENLSEIEQRVIRLYYGLGCDSLNQCDLSKLFGVSQPSISRIRKRSIAKLKKALVGYYDK